MMIRKFSDRLLRLRLTRDERELKIGFFITGIIIILLFANVIYLNFLVVKNNNGVSSSSNLDKAGETISNPTQAQSLTPTIVLQRASAVSTKTNSGISYKDYYINLGYGSNKSTEWADVAGTISTFDIAEYKNIKEVRLETTTNVPTSNGTVSVRLFNKTDGYAVWNSERTVLAESQGSLLISEKLNYDHGPKMYQIQMKSQLGVEANLIQARLHIVAEQ